MEPTEAFILADQTLNAVVQQVRDDQWSMAMPPEFKTAKPDHVPTLREIIAYHAYDDAWFPDMLAGRTMDEVGREKFDGDLLGGDPRRAFADIVERACAAAAKGIDPDQPLHFSYGDWPARDGLWHLISFRGLRAHDIAAVIGVDTTLPSELVQAMWDAFSPVAATWRQMGVFGPEVEVAASAPLQDRLLGLTGRQPDVLS